MPNIRSYENKVGLNPDDRAARSTSFAANSVRMSYGELGRELGSGISAAGQAYTKYRTQGEISQGLGTSATQLDNLTTTWDVMLKNADPNDPTTGQKFRTETLDPQLDEWVSAFETEGGKLWAQNQADRMRRHFFEKTAADQSSMAGVAAIKNIRDFGVGMSNTALQDPSSLTLILGTVDDSIAAIVNANPHIDAVQAAKITADLGADIRREATTSAFQGMARANPDAAMEALKNGFGEQDLKGTERERMFGFAESLKESRAADAKSAATAETQRLKAEGDAFLTKSYAAGIQKDGSWLPPKNYAEAIREAAFKNPEAFSANEVKAAIGAAEHAVELVNNRTFQMTDPATYERFRKTLAGNDKTDIDEAYADGKLSTKDWTFLKGAIEDAASDPRQATLTASKNQFFAGIKGTITKSNPYAMQVYPEQDQRYYEFQRMVDVTVQYGIKTLGMTPDEAAFTYLDPRGPKYLGALAPRYQLSQPDQEAAEMRDGGARVLAPVQQVRPAGAPAPKKFKSIADYEASKGK